MHDGRMGEGKERDKIGDWLLRGEFSGINHLHKEAFTVDQYSTSKVQRNHQTEQLPNGRSRRFRLGRRVLRPLHPSKNNIQNPKAHLLENLGSVMLEISWVTLPFMVLIRIEPRSSINSWITKFSHIWKSGKYTVVNQVESPGQICIDNRPSRSSWPRRRLPFRIIYRCFLLNSENLIRRRITSDNSLKRRPVYGCAIKWHLLLGRAKSFNA